MTRNTRMPLVEGGGDGGVERGVDRDVGLPVGGDAGDRRAGTAIRSASSSAVVTVTASRPWARASATTSVPWGVPNSCSKRSSGSSVAWGRNEKIPPPSLSTTMTRRSTPLDRSAVSAPPSWRNAMSPTSATVGTPPRATPSAVETTPSMPLAPRLA